ncbi:hypothetical protein [Mesorhizobium sp.]|uniref:hypothetical protein n=1 Tax=Mesorhizobium sp. TaxID=1871066 RepID=UPI0011FB47C3|nr:hypothetical protein [Mesorhizobium sp.]TIS88022.1 MAG: hypothetical protein E5W89_22700 [Mesorhizobium sp.]
MCLFHILLRADNSSQPFPKQDFDRLKEEPARRVDGVTAHLQSPAEGLWRHGHLYSDDGIVIFEAVTEEIDLREWRTRHVGLEQRFRQDQVVIS